MREKSFVSVFNEVRTAGVFPLGFPRSKRPPGAMTAKNGDQQAVGLAGRSNQRVAPLGRQALHRA
jgi:hypothetical protein